MTRPCSAEAGHFQSKFDPLPIRKSGTLLMMASELGLEDARHQCKEMQRDAKSMLPQLPQLPQLTAILAILAVLAILYFALTYLDFNLFNVLLPKT